MSLPTYSTGTVSVGAGGTVVTGTGGVWTGTNAKQGDFISINNLAAVLITEVTDATHLKIPPWPGAAQSNVTYQIFQNYVGRVVGVAAAEDVGIMLQKLHTDGLPFIVGSAETVPDPSYGDEGQYAYKPTSGQWWIKSGGVWVASVGPVYGVGEAPTDGLMYGRQGSAWHRAVAVAGDTITGGLVVNGSTFTGNPITITYGSAPTQGTLFLGNSGAVGLSYNGSVNTLLGSPVAIPNATPSSSPTTGALTVGGGVGIGGTLSASKKIQIGNLITGGATAELLISSSDPTGVSQIAIGDGDSRNLGFLWYNSASGFQPSSAHVSTYGYNWPLFFDASALSLQVNCGMPTTIGGKLAVTINTPSTSASNGAIVVGGGVGIGGQVSADGGFACTGPVASTNALKARGSGSNIFIGANGNGIAAPPGTAGIILVNDSSVNGKAAVLVIGAGGTSVLGGAAGHVWNATTTPAANTFGFGWDGTNWKIYNGFASAVQFTSLSISLT